MKTTAATGPVAAAIALCMSTYHPAPSWPSLKCYTVTLLVDEHLLESCEVSARFAQEAITRAIDLRRAEAIRTHRPDLSIQPHAITACRLTA